MTTPIIPQRYIDELAAGIMSHDARRVAEGKASFCRMAERYREAGHSPIAFRADVCRASMPNAWQRDLTDTVPGVTDAALDTMRRRAIKQALGVLQNQQNLQTLATEWVTTQPRTL